jgi:VWFA-related protein
MWSETAMRQSALSVYSTAAFFLATAGLVAQTQPAEVTTREEMPTFQSSVSLVRVPVVIRDKQGHPVGGLQKQDFQIADHGKPQYISQFSIEGGAVAKPAAKAPASLEMPGDPAAASPKLVVPTRFVAYVFDDIHLKMGDLAPARAAALKHIEHGIPPEERIALFTLSGRTQIEFTDDVAKFRDALMKIAPVPPTARVPPASFYMGEQYARSPSFMTTAGDILAGPPDAMQLQTRMTLDCLNMWDHPDAAVPLARNTLEEVAREDLAEATSAIRILNNMVRLMSAMPGDRVMVLVSPGIYLPDELQRSLNESIDRATHAGVIINTLDARGVYAIDPSGDVGVCGDALSDQTRRDLARTNREEAMVQGMILRELAASTGGNFAAQNDLQAEFDRLALPPEYVYYLGFYPKDLKPDGKFHEIKVTLPNGKGLTATARKGYWAPSHEENAAATATREITEAVFSHDEMRELALDLHTQFYKTSPEDAKATIASNVDLGHLPLRKQDGRNRDDVTVVCALFDRNGNFLQGRQTVVEIRLKDENVESRRARGITVNHEFDVKSGDYLVRVVARDAEGRQMAAVNGVVEIP